MSERNIVFKKQYNQQDASHVVKLQQDSEPTMVENSIVSTGNL